MDAALDPEVVDRRGAMCLIHMASVGHTRRRLDWQEIRDAKDPLYERRAWDMVASEQERLRVLLDDDDGAVSRLALVILARTGDADRRTVEAMRSAVGSSEARQRCNGWLSTASLGVLPAGLEAPWPAAADTDALTRFGVIVAGLRFEAAWVDGVMVDELCSVLPTTRERFGYDQCDFVLPDNRARERRGGSVGVRCDEPGRDHRLHIRRTAKPEASRYLRTASPPIDPVLRRKRRPTVTAATGNSAGGPARLHH